MSPIVDDILAHRFKWRPVDATFTGAEGHDHRLPPVESGCIEAELEEIERLLEALETADEVHPHDRRMLRSELLVERTRQTKRPRQRNPAWATGEAAFAIVSLLLPQSAPWREDAIANRLKAIPQFFSDVRSLINTHAVPAGWIERAHAEADAMATFLREDMRQHEAWTEAFAGPAEAAAEAFMSFVASLDGSPDADPACGVEHLDFLLSELHQLSVTSAEAIEAAESAFDRTTRELEEMARDIDPHRDWQAQIAELATIHPKSAADILESYRQIDDAARRAADTFDLVSPNYDYGLEYRLLPPCFKRIAGALYFLFYRSPPALNPGKGSVYWVMNGDDPSAHSSAMVKTVHAVHHGSVGHHTQNARARAATSRMGRIAATDCALGLAFPGSLTLVEGWACHVEDLLIEADGFYSPAEFLLLKSFERRNAASVLVDLGLHSGAWTQAECETFYAEKAGYAPARVHGEIIRNSIFPGSRATYWLGVEGIRALRARWTGSTRDFHDTLLSFGHVPLRFVEEVMEAMGKLS